ncbi:hypothetical protein MM817_02894 [Acidibacillus sp. S0AB]|uniref:Uncharacterized protein n=1 Tax=Sulfoacidibacillus ferrooxidans TaxID=2005001 RepID=A0A9X1VEL4_9BACL|nr:hypothetical protein [Sulfoacidibacillus ferrooxidans]
MTMIAHSSTSRQLPNSFKIVFDNLHIGHHLRRAGVTECWIFLPRPLSHHPDAYFSA